MEISFIPRARLLESLEAGFSLVPGHEYAPGDYAILMAAPIEGVVLQADTAAIMRYLNPPKKAPRRCIRGHLIALAKPCRVCARARDKLRWRARKAVLA